MRASLFQYQQKAEPINQAGTPVVPDISGWGPHYPAAMLRALSRPTEQAALTEFEVPTVVPDLPGWLGVYPAFVLRGGLPHMLHPAHASNLDPIANPTVPALSWQSQYPDWIPLQRPVDFPHFVTPIGLSTLTAQVFLGMTPDFVADILEESSGVYLATLRNEVGNPIATSQLSSIVLTLYAIKADRTIAYVNARAGQNVFNVNDVTLYNSLQTRASDGKTFNLRWAIQPSDTTLVDVSLPFERHIGLFTYTWPTGKVGRHEIVLNVKNLGEVS